MQQTTAKTNGLTNGYTRHGRQAGCNASAFLSKPCNRFQMPPQRRKPRTAGTAHGNVKKRSGFDEEIIARYPRRWKQVAFGIFVALLMSGILPMSVAAFEIWLGESYGFLGYALGFGADVALIAWLVKRYA